MPDRPVSHSMNVGNPGGPAVSDTPKTDRMIAELEAELGDGPPNISEAAIDVAVRLRLVAHARNLERLLNDAHTAMQEYIAGQLQMDEHDYRRDPVNQPRNIR